jgi:transcriptional regulator with XRE-family HTH domain
MSTPLQKIRTKLKISQTEISKSVGINQGNFSRIERGIDTPTAANAEKIAEFINTRFGHPIISELEILYPKRRKAA